MLDAQLEPPQKRLKSNDEEAEVKTAGWSDLPNELKLMVISHMEDLTPFNFAQCSKQSHSLAIASGKLCNMIELTENRKSSFGGSIHPDYELHFKVSYYYCSIWFIRFYGEPDSTSTRVSYMYGKTTFLEFEEKGKFFEIISRYMNKYLERYKDCLEKFEMSVRCQAKSHLVRGIELPTMTKLKVFDISDTPRHLCLFRYKFVDFDTVRRVRKRLVLPSTQLTFEQLVQLQASYIEIYLNDLTADDLNQYMKYWQDGKLSRNFNFIRICGGYSVKNPKRKEISVNYDGLELEKTEHETRIRSNFDKTKYLSVSEHPLYFTLHISHYP